MIRKPSTHKNQPQKTEHPEEGSNKTQKPKAKKIRSSAFGPEKRIKKRRDFVSLQNKGKQGGSRQWKTDHFMVVCGKQSEAPIKSKKAQRPLTPNETTIGQFSIDENTGDITPLSTQSEKIARLGITITRKVHKRAVKRNLLKRRVREVFRKLHSFILEPLDIVVIAHKEATSIDYKEVKRELNYALRRLGLLEDKRNKNRAVNDSVKNRSKEQPK